MSPQVTEWKEQASRLWQRWLPGSQFYQAVSSLIWPSSEEIQAVPPRMLPRSVTACWRSEVLWKLSMLTDLRLHPSPRPGACPEEYTGATPEHRQRQSEETRLNATIDLFFSKSFLPRMIFKTLLLKTGHFQNCPLCSRSSLQLPWKKATSLLLIPLAYVEVPVDS